MIQTVCGGRGWSMFPMRMLDNRMTLIMAFVFECYFVVGASALTNCPERLLWHEKHFIDHTQSFHLQICCNVTKIWLSRLTPVWRLDSINKSVWKDVDELTLPGFELTLSKCGNQTMLGNVINANCILERGNIVTLTRSDKEEEILLQEFDHWYVTCYQLNKVAYTGSSCSICKLDKFCTTHGRCRESFLHIEVVNASLNSFTVLLNVGDIPFDPRINLEVSDAYKRSNNISRTSFTNVPRNYTLAYKVENLMKDTWYTVNVCVVVDTPSSFRLTYPNIVLPKQHIFCLKDEGRTLWTKGAQKLSCEVFLLMSICFLLGYICRNSS